MRCNRPFFNQAEHGPPPGVVIFAAVIAAPLTMLVSFLTVRWMAARGKRAVA